MYPTEVLRQAGVLVNREFHFEPALPFAMRTVGSGSENSRLCQPHSFRFWAYEIILFVRILYGIPYGRLSRLIDLRCVVTRCRLRYVYTILMIALLITCTCGLWIRGLLLFQSLAFL